MAQSLDGLRRLMSPGLLTGAVILGGLAWAAEGLALWIVVVALGEWVSPLIAIPIFGGGGPGGRGDRPARRTGGLEGSMVALLRQAGLNAPRLPWPSC